MQMIIQSFLGQIYQHDPELRVYETHIILYLQDALRGQKSFIVDEVFIVKLHEYLETQKAEEEMNQVHEPEPVGDQNQTPATEDTEESVEEGLSLQDDKTQQEHDKKTEADCASCVHKPSKFRFWGGFFIGLVLMIVLGFLAFVSHQQGLLPAGISLDKLWQAQQNTGTNSSVEVIDTSSIMWQGQTYTLSGIPSFQDRFDILSVLTQDTDVMYGQFRWGTGALTGELATCLGSYVGAMDIELYDNMPVFAAREGDLSWASYTAETNMETLLNSAKLLVDCAAWGTGSYVLDTPEYSYQLLERDTMHYFVPVLSFAVREDGTMNAVGVLPVVVLPGYYN